MASRQLSRADLSSQDRATFVERWSRLQEAMAEQQLDALIVAARGMIGQFGNVFYLCGYTPLLRVSYGVLGSNGEPVLFVPSRSDVEVALERAVLDDVRSSAEMEVQRSETPMAQAVADEVVRRRPNRVGLVGLGQTVPVADSHVFEQALRESELVDASAMFAAVKARKTKEDLEGLRAGFKLAEHVYQLAPPLLRSGARAQEVVAELERELRSNGGLETLVFVDSSPYWVRRNTPTIFQAHDLVMVLVEVATVDGYYVELGGLFSIGEPSPEGKAVADACYTTLSAIKETIKPNTPIQAATAIHEQLATENKLGLSFALGHGIGIDNDLPTLYRTETSTFQVDQVVSVHPHYTHPTGVFGGVADAFWVTDGGCQQLSSLDYFLTVL